MTSPTLVPVADDEVLRSLLQSDLLGMGIAPIGRFRPPAPPISEARRAAPSRPPTETIEVLTLLRDADGLLRWEPGLAPGILKPDMRRAGRAALPPGKVVEQFAFTRIPPNDVGKVLQDLDKKLTPFGVAPSTAGGIDSRVRRWDQDELVPFNASQAAGKKVLLLVHGTFSNNDSLFREIGEAPDNTGQQFLAAAAKHYDHILAFDHPTVSCSPIVNSFDLAAVLRPSPASIDVICHSRGGLVTRWFFEGFADPAMKRRAILVATSIGGTSLAAPFRLKSAIRYLTNIGDILGRTAKIGALVAPHPFVTAAGALMTILTSVTRIAAGSPLLDTAVALVPGLQGQSRVGNNVELDRLRANTGNAGLEYYAVKSDFQPDDPGWNILRYFSKPMQRIAGFGADLIFEGANDLVVDTASMTELADTEQIHSDRILDFGTSTTVHHTNYFRQKATIEFIRQKLGII